MIATRFGIEAIDAVHEGDFGVMVALRGTDVSASRSKPASRSSRPSTAASSTPPPSSSAEHAAEPAYGLGHAPWARRSTI